MVVFAAPAAPVPLDLDLVYRREVILAGVRSGSPGHLRRALALLEEGDLALEWYRPEVVDLDGLPGAVDRYRRGQVLKAVVGLALGRSPRRPPMVLFLPHCPDNAGVCPAREADRQEVRRVT